VAELITSPVLMRPAAFITLAGFMWLPEPRSSPAPHFDGHRSDSAGGDQLGLCANVAPLAKRAVPTARPNAIRLIDVSP
jgi:hypothetical protein